MSSVSYTHLARVYGPHKDGMGEQLRHRLMLAADAIHFEGPAKVL